MATQDQRSQATRSTLTAAGRALFAECGYAGVSVAELAARAGVTTGALYHQFTNKQGLFEAVYADVLRDLSQRIVSTRNDARKPTLIADCEVYLDACTDPAFRRIAVIDGPVVLGSDLALDGAQTMVAGALLAARERGELADVPIEPLARMLGAALKEAGSIVAAAADPVLARSEARESAERLLAGLLE
jgi:AcrR family transcriptional regulator